MPATRQDAPPDEAFRRSRTDCGRGARCASPRRGRRIASFRPAGGRGRWMACDAAPPAGMALGRVDRRCPPCRARCPIALERSSDMRVGPLPQERTACFTGPEKPEKKRRKSGHIAVDVGRMVGPSMNGGERAGGVIGLGASQILRRARWLSRAEGPSARSNEAESFLRDRSKANE